MNFGRSLIVVMMAVPCLSGFASACAPVKGGPFPIDVSREGSKVEGRFSVGGKDGYVVYLEFNYNGHQDLDRFMQLTGDPTRLPNGQLANPGVVVPIHLIITKNDGKIIYDQLSTAEGFDIHGFPEPNKGFFGRRIVGLLLEPGTYNITAYTTSNLPMFAGTPCTIAILREVTPGL